MANIERTPLLQSRLLEMRDRLQSEIEAANVASKSAMALAGGPAQPRMDPQQKALALLAVQKLTNQSRRVAAALDRIAQLTYGVCCECGGEVEADRLDADPPTPFCAECQVDLDAQKA